MPIDTLGRKCILKVLIKEINLIQNAQSNTSCIQNRILLYYIVNNVARYSDNANRHFGQTDCTLNIQKKYIIMIKHKDIGHIIFSIIDKLCIYQMHSMFSLQWTWQASIWMNGSPCLFLCVVCVDGFSTTSLALGFKLSGRSSGLRETPLPIWSGVICSWAHCIWAGKYHTSRQRPQSSRPVHGHWIKITMTGGHTWILRWVWGWATVQGSINRKKRNWLLDGIV